MAGEWRAWALPDVSEASLRAWFVNQGVPWDGSLHVAATGSLAREMRRSGTPAVSIAMLLDIVVWAGMPDDRAMPVDAFPTLRSVADDGGEAFESALKPWSNEVAGRNLRLGIRADLRLRRFLDQDAPDIAAARVLRRSVRDLRKAIQSVATAGFETGDFDDADAIPRVARAAWQRLESEVSELFRLRDDVWTDPGEFGAGSTPHAVQLRKRIDAVLHRLLGGAPGHRSVVYHGFYFYTPHQWAWFQLLRQHGSIDQLFIVHDDGVGRAFETWRRYFVDRWSMPRPQQLAADAETSRAAALAAALTGTAVPSATPGGPTQLYECGSSTEFINLWRSQRIAARDAQRKDPLLFAAGAGDIERLVRRLDFDADNGEVNLAELPIGQFLLALHGCVETLPGGRHRLVLDRTRLIDMVASRLLDSGDLDRDPSHHVAAFERAMPFFDDCTLLADWVARAVVLQRLVVAEVSALGKRAAGLTDRQRIAVAASNPLRLVPWADLSDLEAAVVVETIRRVTEMAERVIAVEGRDPEKYLGWIRQNLERGMANLPAEERKVVEDKLRGIGAGNDGEFDVEGIIDVVHMLLGRQAEFGLDGDSDDESAAARELRNLDALGFAPSERDVHVANLVDTEFPARYQSFRWPFDERLLKSGAQTSQVSVEIFRTREETASLSDLYLFWLALSGVSPSATLTLSWITELGTEIRNPSSLVLLIASLDHKVAVLKSAVGGLEVRKAGSVVAMPPDRTLPTLRVREYGDAELDDAIAHLEPLAASSAFMCPRRFAVQWAMGPSAAFQTPHTQRMLYGNVQGALQKKLPWGWPASEAVRITKDLWRQFTKGERMSSFVKGVVKPDVGAAWKWILTLKGTSKGTDPASLAYQAAYAGSLPPTDTVAPPNVVLPTPDHEIVDEAICNMCPVKPRCALQALLRDR